MSHPDDERFTALIRAGPRSRCYRCVRQSKLAVVFVLGFVGCFNPDPPTAEEANTLGSSTGGGTSGGPQTTSTDPSVGSSESGPGVCETCVATVPEGWQGPLVFGMGETAPSCAAPYTAVVFQAAEDISGEDASCGCECGDPGIDCDSLQVQYADTCEDPPDVENFRPGSVADDLRGAQDFGTLGTTATDDGVLAFAQYSTDGTPETTQNAQWVVLRLTEWDTTVTGDYEVLLEDETLLVGTFTFVVSCPSEVICG